MKSFTKGILFILLIMSCLNAHSGHLTGTTMQYECLGGNEYKVFLSVFRNCNELTPLPPLATVGVTGDCSVFYGNFSLVLIEVQDISQLCDEELALSSCNTDGTLPGVQL